MVLIALVALRLFTDVLDSLPRRVLFVWGIATPFLIIGTQAYRRAMGVNLVRFKLMAFAIGAAFAGMTGVYFVAKLQTATPEMFTR